MKRPLAAALVLFAIAAAVMLAIGLRLTRGALVFPLDDAYIHFAIARTLVEHHAYGLQPGAFSTPASSLVWPLFLAGARVLGVPFEATALTLGVAGGAGALFVVDRVLVRSVPSTRATLRFAVLALFAIVVPLVPMALLGMEHALHVAVVLALVADVVRDESSPQAPNVRIFLLAALAVSLRYESAFVIAALVAFSLPAPEKRPTALALTFGAALPVAVAAVFFGVHGAPPLPASVVLKRTHASLAELPAIVMHRFVEHPHVPALLIMLGVAAGMTQRREIHAWIVVAAAALVGQATFAQLGWLYRYESYAVALAVVALALTVAQAQAAPEAGGVRLGRGLVAAFAVLAIPAFARAAFAHSALPRASRNVAEQQAQVARFVHAAAPGGAVAVNDVGAVAYWGGARVLDLLGLADLRVAHARGMRIDAPLARADLERFTRQDGVRLAVLYEPWFAAVIPTGWVPLERWRIRDNRVCAFDTVTFYATEPGAATELRQALDAYRPRLPQGVEALPILPRK